MSVHYSMIIKFNDRNYSIMIGAINLIAKLLGKHSAGNPHATFDVAGTGNVLKINIVATVLDPTLRTVGVKLPCVTRLYSMLKNATCEHTAVNITFATS